MNKSYLVTGRGIITWLALRNDNSTKLKSFYVPWVSYMCGCDNITNTSDRRPQGKNLQLPREKKIIINAHTSRNQVQISLDLITINLISQHKTPLNHHLLKMLVPPPKVYFYKRKNTN